MAEGGERRAARLLGRQVDYVLHRSPRRRTLALMVDHRGLTVRAPLRVAEWQVARFLEESAPWVLKKLDEWAARGAAPVDWVDGAELLYLGRTLRLTLLPGNAPATPVVSEGVLAVAAGDPARAARRVLAWYRRQAFTLFAARVAHYAEKLGVPPPPLLLSGARSRWGSCTAQGVIRLNWRLVQAPETLVDYVVAHELAHLKHLDHSPRFWRVVESLYPDWREARVGLRTLGPRLAALPGK